MKFPPDGNLGKIMMDTLKEAFESIQRAGRVLLDALTEMVDSLAPPVEATIDGENVNARLFPENAKQKTET